MISSSSGSEGKKLVQKGKETLLFFSTQRDQTLLMIYINLMPVLVRVIKAIGNPKAPNMIITEENMLLGQAKKS